MCTLLYRLATAFLLLLSTQAALAQQIEVLWLGHSTFRITSRTGKVIVIDPFFLKNPRAPAKYRDLKALGKVDLILITHGHGDHVSDVSPLAGLTGAQIVAPHELAHNLVTLGLTDASKTIAMNKGGTVSPIGPGIKIRMVRAEHGSGLDLNFIKPEAAKEARFIHGGEPVGYIVEFENGFRIYHAGDTDVFGDMALIGKLHRPDLALIPIGGHYTMGPEDAAYAMREFVHPKQIIPMHYGTFPVINRTPAELKAALGDAPIKVLEVKPGDAARF